MAKFKQEEELRTEIVVIKCPKCPVCGLSGMVIAPLSAWNEYANGMHVQNAFPMLNADQREMIVSGTHSKCWDELWGDDEDYEDDEENN